MKYFADFETTAFDNKNGVKVYLWCIVSEESREHGFELETFINYCKKLNKGDIIYFHNLKFDFSFIHHFLISNNIDYGILEKEGIIYTVRFFDIELRDSTNFLPITLKEVGENYCTNFKKTSIDYNVDFDHKASEKEIEYCYNDCYVLMEGLTNYFNALKEVLEKADCKKTLKSLNKKITNAGIAFEAFKELSIFSVVCPKTTPSQYRKFRRAYKGGYVYSRPSGIIKNVTMIDCNSMYPFIYSTIPLPYGRGYNITEKEMNDYRFYIANVFIKYELKDGYIPIIGGGVGRYGGIDYKSSSNYQFEEYTFCNIDLELIKEFYECEIIYNWVYGFETKENFFKTYADTFIKMKNENKGVKRAVAKVLLNSPYGKTAMNGLQEIKRYYIDEEDNIVKSEVTGYEIDNNAFQYLPMAICITAGARNLLLRTAKQIGFDRVYYMDTDSIKFTGELPSNIDIDNDRLGAWKVEGMAEYFKTIAPKKYCYYENGIINFTCAGFNKKVLESEMKHKQQVNIKECIELMNKFDINLELECLQSKKVKGGRALIPVKKEIK